MKKTVRYYAAKTLKSSFALEWLYNNYYKLKNKKSFFKEIERRKHLSIFDYVEIAQDIPFCPLENIKDSNYYGHAYSMKKYADLDYISSGIEHGIYLGNRISDAERLRTTKSVIAMSQNRVESFKENNIEKPIIAVGPYIHYATPFYNEEEFSKLKEQLGRVLLVFPFHSGIFNTISFDLNLLISEIEKRKKSYDTVMVCLHHLDVIRNEMYRKKYHEMGYKIVCAGHKYDLNFISRLKSIISLSDFVISNSIGTQVGYCYYMHKPQIILFDDGSLPEIKNSAAYNTTTAKLAREQTLEIIKAFSTNENEDFSEEQALVVEKYWGLSQIKKPQELRLAIETLNKI